MNKLIFLYTLLVLNCASSYASSALAGYDIKNNNIALSFHSFKQEVTHQETSSNSSFNAQNKETSSSLKALSLIYSREFFAKKTLSFTLSAGRGKILGGGSQVDDPNDFQYETEVQDTATTTLGFSINLNFTANNLKVQPFVSFSLHREEFQMETKFTTISSQDVTIIKYENEISRNLLSLGARFFDPQTQLLSVFSLSYKISETQENNFSSATINDSPVSLTTSIPNIVSSADLSFSIMVGHSF